MLAPFFFGMSSCPPDPAGAAAFRYAITSAPRDDGSRGYDLKEIAGFCDVAQSLVTKWCRQGNVPEAHIDQLPEDVQRLYAEHQGRRRGVIVLERDLVADAFSFFWSLAPAAIRASLAPAECGALSRSLERRRA